MTTSEDVVVPADIIESLELLMFGAIGMTTLALAAEATGELTLPQWRALVVIGRGQDARVGEIAAAVGMTLPSASRLVRRLENRGLVTTGPDEADRRATLVRMTAQGRQVRQEVVNRRRAMMEAALIAHAPSLPRDLVAGLAAIAGALAEYA